MKRHLLMHISSDNNSRRIPEEKGPFGKSMRRRATSRSKTATPARKEDQAKLDNAKYIDDIFGAYKASQSNQGEASTGLENINTTASVPAALAGEPTEVIFYGFGSDLQWAAIEFYERVSGGIIYEDYDRHPPHSKYNLSLSLNRARSTRLSAEALRKRNNYNGGEHWIKVTFDSAEAADTACYNSPHILHGHIVYAERYRGIGPKEDVAILASPGQLTSATGSPNTRSSNTLRADNPNSVSPFSSHTASSATATGTAPTTASYARPSSLSASATVTPDAAPAPVPQTPTSSTTALERTQQHPSPLRIRGAKRVVLLPADQAFLPVATKWQRTLSSIPLLGTIFGAGNAIIGSQVPRKEDGSFDSENASWYWQFWYLIDYHLGTDFCGIKAGYE
jgi:hypothetical protein